VKTNDTPVHVSQVGYSWWTSGAGGALALWQWATEGMSPLAAFLAMATLVLTAIKIVQEVMAVRNQQTERTVMRKMLDRLSRRSGFDPQDTR